MRTEPPIGGSMYDAIMLVATVMAAVFGGLTFAASQGFLGASRMPPWVSGVFRRRTLPAWAALVLLATLGPLSRIAPWDGASVWAALTMTASFVYVHADGIRLALAAVAVTWI